MLDVASRLFALHGYDGVSMRDLAESVGVTPPALYRHFADKEEILQSIIEQTTGRMVRIMEGHRDSPDALVSLVSAYTTEVLDRPEVAITYLRERHRLVGNAESARRANENALLDLLVEPYGVAYPELDRTAMVSRIIAALGALRGYGEHGVRLPRPAADGFVAASLLELLGTPMTGPVGLPFAQTAWAPELSQRERILRAALPVFRERGFAGVGMAEIGERAGVGPTNVGRYYCSKEEILVDIYDRVGARVEVGLDEAIASADDAEDALDRMLRSYCRIAFESADLVVVVSNNRGAIPAAERQRLRRRARRVTGLWAAIVAEVRSDLRPIEVEAVVTAVVPMVNMFPQQLEGDLPEPEIVAALVRSFVLGAGPGEP